MVGLTNSAPTLISSHTLLTDRSFPSSKAASWGMQTVIPPSLRQPILKELHRAHPGIARMKATAHSHVWWPGVDNDIEETANANNALKPGRLPQLLLFLHGHGPLLHDSTYRSILLLINPGTISSWRMHTLNGQK